MKRCLYEVLDLSPDATEEDIKKSYRRFALKFHPDKNPNDAEAHGQFLAVQEAYETLSDSQERAWYDNHRDQILNNDEDQASGSDPASPNINIYRWFRHDCFNGFSESVDESGGTKCFYTVYRAVFEVIANEEVKRSKRQSAFACQEFQEAPTFGTAAASTDAVNCFYRFWSRFSTQRNFGFSEIWNLKDAPNRFVRRHMEAENKQLRKDARTEFNDSVRALVAFVKKRDPRLAAARLEKASEAKRLAEKKAEERDRLEEERKRNREIARINELKRREEVRLEKAATSGSQVFLGDEESSSAEDVESSTSEADDTAKAARRSKRRKNIVIICEACKKMFKSEAQFKSHEKSRKHLVALAELFENLIDHQEIHHERIGVEIDGDDAQVDDGDDAQSDDVGDDAQVDAGDAAQVDAGDDVGDDAQVDDGDDVKVDDDDDGNDGDDAQVNDDGDDAESRADDGDTEEEEASNKSDTNTDLNVTRKWREPNSAVEHSKRQQQGSHSPASAVGTEVDASSSTESSDDELLERLRQLRVRPARAECLTTRNVNRVEDPSSHSCSSTQEKNNREEEEAESQPEKETALQRQGKKKKNKMNKQTHSPTDGKPHRTASIYEGTSATAPSVTASVLPTLATCSICSEKFSTRNLLFKHIKESNHMALKDGSSCSKSRGTKKKRVPGR